MSSWAPARLTRSGGESKETLFARSRLRLSARLAPSLRCKRSGGRSAWLKSGFYGCFQSLRALRLGVNILEVSSGAYECMKKGLASQPEIEILRLSKKNPGGVMVYTVTLKTICFRHLGVTQWFPLERHGAGVTPLCYHLLDSLCPSQMWLPPRWLNGANLCSGPLCRRCGLSPWFKRPNACSELSAQVVLRVCCCGKAGRPGCSTFSVPPPVSQAGLAEGASAGNAPVR
jgi:hypothetical protein